MRAPLLALVLLAASLAGCAKEEPVQYAGFVDEGSEAPPDDAPASSSAPGARPTPTSSPASTPTPPTSEPEPVAPESVPLLPLRPNAVIALIDDGINPYHDAFRSLDPLHAMHPSAYLPGYPSDAVAITLSFGHAKLDDAIAADCAQWAAVRSGTLYWFPGTRIVGAIAPEGVSRFACDDDRELPLLVGDGHGTMSASRAAGNAYGACPTCLLVMAQGFDAPGVTWASRQPWIDLQSNSWGPLVFAPGVNEPSLGLLTATPALARAVEDAARAQPSFWATGNGAAGRLGISGHPSQASWHLTPSAIRVGGHDSGRVALWPGSSPHVVSDACSSWAAEHADNTRSTPTTGSGTSAATPYAAGIAARILLDARTITHDLRTGAHDGGHAVGAPVVAGPLDDGILTRDEWLSLALKTAAARPARTEHDGEACDALDALGPGGGPFYGSPPVEWSAIPREAPAFPLVGYGALTLDTAWTAGQVLRGLAPMPERLDEDAWFAQDRQQREAVHSAYGGN